MQTDESDDARLGVTGAPTAGGNWLSGVTGLHWRTLSAAFIGWGFDGYETFALVVVLAPLMSSIGVAQAGGDIALFGGIAVGVTLAGWAVGGVVGGWLADRYGRRRIMIVSILVYAVGAGLTALTTSYEMLIVLRVITGLALGSEWGTGTTLIAETWPPRARAKAAGFMQCGFGFGSLLASLVWLIVGEWGPEAWRLVFLIGVLPALFTLYIRLRVPESPAWQKSVGDDDSQQSRPATFSKLFSNPTSRRRMLLTLGLSLFSIGAYYTISTSLPLFVRELAQQQGLSNIAALTALSGVSYNVGAIFGYALGGFLADWWGRRIYIATYLVGAVAVTPILYLTTNSVPTVIFLAALNGFFTLGIFAAFAIYLPELFPARIRATSIGVVFNSTRIIAALGPVFFGALVLSFGGVALAAVIIGTAYLFGLVVLPFLPETRGRPLPE